MSMFGDLICEKGELIGLWQALATPYTAEICAGAGFDWLMFDGEHAPNTLQTLLGQLQAISSYPVHPVARPPSTNPALIKQYLDIGFPTLLCPMIDSAEHALRTVAATRFPPVGILGVASATSRASRFGADRTNRMPSLAHPIARERATLLPSPTKTTVRFCSLPKISCIVNRSPRAWQGW